MFEILGKPAAPAQPCECSFDNPSARQKHEALGRVRAFDDLDRGLSDIAAEPVVSYQSAAPGGLIYLDINRLGHFERVGHRITGDRRGQSNSRGVGW